MNAQSADGKRRKSQVISICNNIDTFELTFLKLKKLAKNKYLDVQLFRINLTSYSQQYVSGEDREAFFSSFCEHNTIGLLLDLIRKNDDPNLFITIMKNLSLISFNLKEQKQVGFFLSNTALSQLLQIKIDRSGINETVEVYIQFLKSIVLRLSNNKYYKIFYNQKKPIFPLLWKVFNFYNQNQQLARTTVKAIILQISKINDFSIKSYLNNFPTLLFFSLFSRYMVDVLARCKEKRDILMMERMSDEICFADDLCRNLEPNTKAYLLNSVLYYPFRYLWNSLQKQELQIIDIQLLLLVIFFNIHFDETFIKLAFHIFFQRRILKQVYSFLEETPKQLRLYSYKQYKTEFEGSRKVVQTHCSNIYNRFNTEIQEIGGEVVHFKSTEKSSVIKKSFIISKDLINSILGPLSWQGLVSSEMKVISQVIGGSVKLNEPVSQINQKNIYTKFLNNTSMKSYEMRQNKFYLQMFERMESDPVVLNVYLTSIKHILRNPSIKTIHNLTAQTFIKQSPYILQILEKKKTIQGITHILQNFFICTTILSTQDINLFLVEVAERINNICLQASQKLLFSYFTDWENYFQVFLNHQIFLQQQKKESKPIQEVNYSILDQEVLMADQQLVIHFYSMLRNVIALLKKQRLKSCQDIVKQLELSSRLDLETLPQIHFIINGVQAHSIIEGRALKIMTVQSNELIFEGCLKRLSMKDIHNNRIQLYILPQKFVVQFKNQEEKKIWIQQICRLSKRIQEIEIKIISNIVENVPQL